jgi:hypothetical protein
MEDWENMNYLVINKAGEWKYFRHMKNIAEYLNTTISKVASSKHHCLRYYQYMCPKREVYIQQLYNDRNKNFPVDTRFIWDSRQRAIYMKAKFDNYPKV